jgi:hypothetical protein
MVRNRREPRIRAHRPPERRPPFAEIQKELGKGLKEQYEPPKDLSHRLFTLLLQLDKPKDKD